MSTSESESENNMSEDDMDEDDTDEDTFYDINDMFDGDDDDDYCDFSDTTHFSALLDSLLEATHSGLPQAITTSSNFNSHVRSAMSSISHSSTNKNIPLSTFGDFIITYLLAPPLIQSTTPSTSYYLSFNPTADSSSSNSLLSDQLFVGNLPRDTTSPRLEIFFNNQNYKVLRVDIKSNNRGAGYAFIRFSSTKIAIQVLHDYTRDNSKFIFGGNRLRINLPKSSRQQSQNITATTIAFGAAPTTASYDITDIYYGTLITGAAMRNIRKGNSIVSSCDEQGIIAHRLNNHEYNISFCLNIDLDKKKLFITSKSLLDFNGDSVRSSSLIFEWDFRDLKGKKINPVWVNQDARVGEIFLLVEVKRPPIILKTQNISHSQFEKKDDTRMPGTALIGHANAWLFKLSSRNRNGDYVKLFTNLRRYNLTQRRFSEYNILSLIETPEAARKNLESIQLLSNDEWVKQNKTTVDDFLERRWPSYPFETKFEIMKLVSKHIITVNDLIVDEKAESILEACSINTLIACTDKIVEQAPRWFSTTCDNDDDDWDKEKEEEKSEEDNIPTTTQNIPSFNNAPSAPVHLRSSIGTSVKVSNTEVISITANMSKLSLVAKEHHLGTFSRLLLYALNELREKHELRRESTTGMYVTKHELRVVKTDPSLIRKIYITPSIIHYEGPFSEEKCAVTREFANYQDRFLRVSFRDEDYRLLHNNNNNMTQMYERIKKILINGVAMCDRKYEFLAFSSSQLREHSCWMFASMNDGITADKIREWMGDFRNVRPVAKFAARLGQSFSTSIKGLQLETQQFREISDKEEFDSYFRKLCFTDGIGIITPRLAEKLIREVRPSESNFCPSAFQIRCGGYKGMVCVDIANCIPPGEIDVYFRRSMNKFIANNFSIDVVRTSTNPSLAYLNRQIILLLSSLAIPNCTFLSLQDRMLKRSLALTGEPHKACESLKDLNELGGNGCHAFLIDYLKTLKKQKEPFTRQILRAFQAFLLKELRTKAKILVPDSWNLFGVVDETRTLTYGQVFIQIDNINQQGGLSKILEGPVIVTRNPCFHPGDIRRLQAVDIPALRKLKNVIVFPMKGLRPHAMEMSGGDLDGDTFWICQHKELIFERNEDPFDYQDQTIVAQKEAEAQNNKRITIEDVCDFFVEYIKADNLGLIANSHLAFADQLPRGAKEEKCLILARMHSVAVDFAKNGQSAPQLTRELRPQKYPHYMEKKDKEKYNSTTILGKLYDELEDYKMDLNENIEQEITATLHFPYESFDVDGYTTFMADANVTKNEYNRELKRVMRQYGIEHEAELVSGYILKFTSKQYSKETKLFELRNEISHAYRIIRDKYLRLFWEEFYSSSDESQEETVKWSEISKKLTWKNQLERLEFHDRMTVYDEVKKKASAWFHITYEPWMKHIRNKNRAKTKNQHTFTNNQPAEQHQRFKGLFSFAWLVYPVLLAIFKEKQQDSENNTESKKKRKKKKKNKKNIKKDSVISSNNNKEQI